MALADTADDHPRGKPTRAPVTLAKRQAACVGAMGLGWVASGLGAVFSTKSEAGPVALLFTGAMFFTIGLGGRLPTGLKFGEAEVELGALQEIVGEIVEEAGAAAQSPDLLQSLNELNRAFPDAARPAIERLFYQQMVVGLLRDSLGDVNVQVELDRGDGMLWTGQPTECACSWMSSKVEIAPANTCRRSSPNSGLTIQTPRRTGC